MLRKKSTPKSMTHPLRIEYPAAVYRIITRGNKRQAIFTDDRDRNISRRWTISLSFLSFRIDPVAFPMIAQMLLVDVMTEINQQVTILPQ